MPIRISTAQLQQIKQVARTQGNLAAYSQLTALGLRYPTLASGVAAANSFFGNTAIELKVSATAARTRRSSGSGLGSGSPSKAR